MRIGEALKEFSANSVVLAEKQQRVYDAGVAEGRAQGGYTEGFDAGRQAEYDAFWDVLQNYGSRTNYRYAFEGWGAEYIRSKYKVIPTSGVYNMFYDNPNLKKVEAAYFDLSQVPYSGNAQTFSYFLGGCPKLEEIEDIGLVPNQSYTYFAAWDYALKKVACIRLNADTNVEFMLYGCTALEDVTIEGEIGKGGINLYQSKNLKHDSIVSFINALSNNTSGLAITFSAEAVNNAFEGGSTGSEWLDLLATKSNWTISLV